MFRHRGERKVKTLEEEVEDMSSSTAELLEEGEELFGICIYTNRNIHTRACERMFDV